MCQAVNLLGLIGVLSRAPHMGRPWNAHREQCEPASQTSGFTFLDSIAELGVLEVRKSERG